MTSAPDDVRAIERDLRARFDVESTDVAVGVASFSVLRPRSAEALISEEDFARDERLPYWADVWPSSLVLAERLLEERGRECGLLELGCGLGVVALGAAEAGYAVTATDYYEDALRFTRVNLARAGLSGSTRHLDWRDLPSDLDRYDVVVASDVLYERPYAALVAAVVARTLAPHGMALLADPGRVAAPDFLDAARSMGLTVSAPDVRPIAVGPITQRISIYTLRHTPPRESGTGRVHGRCVPNAARARRVTRR